MIEYLNGKLSELTPALAVVDCQGVGYALSISLNTFTALQGKESAKLYVYENIRDDAWVLFGFVSKEERELFLMLLSVSGVGGNTARMILSSFTPSELANVIMTANEGVLKSIKGLGTKTAQRIIVELKDKLKNSKYLDPQAAAGGASGAMSLTADADEALAALAMLGFPPAPSKKVVTAILKKDPTLPVEQIVKQALKML